MKVEVIKNEDQETTYPWLGVNADGVVVYFYEETCGVVMKESKEGSGPREGLHHEAWKMSFFKPFTGKLVLSNE